MPAVPFITVDEEGVYRVRDQALAFLRSIKGGFGVIAVAGKYRTGKSLFLNKVVLGDCKSDEGFDVGASVQSCTKGIWIYDQLMHFDCANGNAKPFIVLDTEGIDSLDADSTHDSKIFSLALLLSSMFVYNSVGSIDEAAMKTLSLVTHICEHLIAQRGGGRNVGYDDRNSMFPTFCWVVRDFTLRLEDKDQVAMSSDDYLEQALEVGDYDTIDNCKRGATTDTKKIKDTIKKCFKDRFCVTLVRPCQEESMIQNLSSISLSDLRPKFVEQVMHTRGLMASRLYPKMYYDKQVTGGVLAQMAIDFTKSVNSGGVPVIRDSWTLLAEIQSRDTGSSVRCQWDEFIVDLDRVIPLSDNELMNRLDRRLATSVKVFEESLLQVDKDAVEALREYLDDSREKTLHRNKNEIMVCLKQALYDTLARLEQTEDGRVVAHIERKCVLPESLNASLQTCDYTVSAWKVLWFEGVQKQSVEVIQNLREDCKVMRLAEEVNTAKLVTVQNELSQVKQEFLNVEKSVSEDRVKNRAVLLELEQAVGNLDEKTRELRETQALVEELAKSKTDGEVERLKVQAEVERADRLDGNLKELQVLHEQLKSDSRSMMYNLQKEFEVKIQALAEGYECDAMRSAARLEQMSKQHSDELRTQSEILRLLQEEYQNYKQEHKSRYESLRCQYQRAEGDLKERLLVHQLKSERQSGEMRTELAVKSVDIVNQKRRLDEYKHASVSHKKVRLDMLRVQSEHNKCRGLVEYLEVENNNLKANVVELRETVSSLEKKCYSIEQKRDVEVLRLRISKGSNKSG
jgi:5-carboxymethyl-2-hydroxymuconate isomerase